MFFVISFTKLERFWWNLVRSFLNKFAVKSCKRFPPHLNNVFTLPCETWNAHCERATAALSEKVTLKFIPPQLWPLNSPALNPVDYSMWEYCERRCTEYTSLTWTYRRRHWRMAAAMTWSSWATPFSVDISSSRSVMSILNTLFCNIFHTL